MHGENHVLLKPRESSKETMQATHMNTYPPFNPISYTSQALHHSNHIRPPTPHGPSQTTLQHTNGSLIKPTILNSHSNRPWSPSNSQPPKQPKSPNYSNHAHTFNYPPPPLNQAQEMAILEQIWNGLSLGRSNNETVSYVHIPVHPWATMALNEVAHTTSLPIRLEPPPQSNPYHMPRTHVRVCHSVHPYLAPVGYLRTPAVKQRNTQASSSNVASLELLLKAIFLFLDLNKINIALREEESKLYIIVFSNQSLRFVVSATH